MNYGAIALAAVAQFVVGMAWYSALFGKVWGQIHGFDKLSKEAQKEMMAKMGPFYAVQLLLTVLTTAVLAQFLFITPDYSPYFITFWIWFGFIFPAQASAVFFGGTPPEWMIKKTAIMAGAALACLMAGAAVLQAF